VSSFEELEAAVTKAAGNATSGYLQAGTDEIMVRNLGMTTSLEDIGRTVIKTRRAIVPRRCAMSAKVDMLCRPMRGDASVNGTMGVVLSLDKAPGFDTLKLTATGREGAGRTQAHAAARRGSRADVPPGRLHQRTPSATSRKPSATGRSW